MNVLAERSRERQTLDYILDMLEQLAVMARATGEEDLSLILRAAIKARQVQEHRRPVRSRLKRA